MKICNRERVTHCAHLNLIRVDYQDKNGTDKNWIYASRGNAVRPDAVVVVPYHTETGKLVLIKEFRVPLEGIQYGFPAGLADPGERIEQAGERELHEETGLTLTRVLKQSPPVFSSSGMTDESLIMLYVECKGRPCADYNEPSEQIDVVMVSREEARELLDRNDLLFDVKTWIVLDRFSSTGRVL